MAYIVAGVICFNEERLVRYSVGSIYDHVDEIVFVDHYSDDKTIDILKELDKNNKITVIKRKWNASYKDARNTYLDYIKKNIYPKHRTDLYYLRIDCDEVYFEDWLKNLKLIIEDNPDKEAFRGNFYCFTQDYNHLDTKNPIESRVSVFKYFPDIKYVNDIHEVLIHANGMPCHTSPFDDSRLGIMTVPGYQYNHYAWCGDIKREFNKAVIYEKHYVLQGKSTKEKVDSMKPSKDSWWFDKVSDIRYKGKLPEVFQKYGLLPGQTIPDEVDGKTKISVYTIIKNSIKFDYPIIEAINSVLPIADEVIVNCGDSEDGTTGLIHKAFDGMSKVKIFNRVWENREEGTAFLRNQSNWAKDQCKNSICLYLQSDEVYHEADLDKILATAKELEESPSKVAAIFKWRHFDGLPTHINTDSYPEEVRLIKRDLLESIGDAQSMGLRLADLTNVMAFRDLLIETDIKVYHYGWLRDPQKMLSKLRDFDKYYHNDAEWNEMHKNDEKRHIGGYYNYGEKIDNFKETHPYTMYPRIRRYEKINNLKSKAMFSGNPL